MNLYPVSLNVQGRVCLVVGGGAVAERKTAGLLAAGASVVVISPVLTPGLQANADAGEIIWHAKPYGTGDLDGVFLVLACTDRREVNAQIVRDASELGLLVLCADDPGAGSFVSPTVIRRGPLTLTVSTEGSSPTLSAVVREKLEADFGPEWGPLTRSIANMREIVKTNPTEAARKAAVRRALDDGETHRLLSEGREEEAEARIRLCLSSLSE